MISATQPVGCLDPNGQLIGPKTQLVAGGGEVFLGGDELIDETSRMHEQVRPVPSQLLKKLVNPLRRLDGRVRRSCVLAGCPCVRASGTQTTGRLTVSIDAVTTRSNALIVTTGRMAGSANALTVATVRLPGASDASTGATKSATGATGPVIICSNSGNRGEKRGDQRVWCGERAIRCDGAANQAEITGRVPIAALPRSRCPRACGR